MAAFSHGRGVDGVNRAAGSISRLVMQVVSKPGASDTG